ncbi:hypothetical protein GQ55_9G482500 [Panicum hallii var. hallii]|uniref:Uncharacterized protein n=1 Tax=Panicum hallii var. hallii TaxID=1504633 RepID=A0A2T7CCV5_9POAL|nr:hypothetical protein GQ55_9G482500 [Panicum hallii var. hallii]
MQHQKMTNATNIACSNIKKLKKIAATSGTQHCNIILSLLTATLFYLYFDNMAYLLHALRPKDFHPIFLLHPTTYFVMLPLLFFHIISCTRR